MDITGHKKSLFAFYNFNIFGAKIKQVFFIFLITFIGFGRCEEILNHNRIKTNAYLFIHCF